MGGSHGVQADPGDVPPLDNATGKYALFPKLFRRLSAYFADHADLDGFQDYLRAHPDPCVVIPGTDPTVLHHLVRVTTPKVRLTVDPEDIMFLPT